jgi:hypothetical protein
MKLRAVANPFRVYQLVLSRLGDQVYDLVKTLPWDCTHDQDEGTRWAQEQMLANKEMFAVDLSDATNLFPLSLQIILLKSIRGINSEDISLFEEISTLPWLSRTHGLVQWTKGQPLGLYPSFGVFTLTHGILLRALEESLQLPEGNFRVLGDDVVISDPSLHNAYREVLQKLRMPVSEDKTLKSREVTEFAGRVITRDSIYAIGKWRRSSDRNFLTLLKTIGPRYLQFLQPRQRRVAMLYMTLPVPIGLGWNPSGLSADAKWELEDKYIRLLESKARQRVFRRKSWPRPLFETGYISLVFDEEPRSDSRPLEGTWTQTMSRSTSSQSASSASIYELHVRINNLVGVMPLADSQFDSLNMSPIDISKLVNRLTRVLDLLQDHTMGDPRGLSELELWERRMKR